MTPKNDTDRKAKARQDQGAKPSGEVSAKDLDKVTGGTAPGLPTGKRMVTSSDPCEGGR
jgi:hypothetical protein